MYNDVENLFYEADNLISQEKIIEAKDLLLEILENDPDYAKAHNHLGWIYHYKMVDFSKAERHYKLALKYSKDYHAPYGNYAYFLLDTNAYEDMLSFGREALKKKFVDKGTIYNQMAKSYELTGNLLMAHDNYKKAKFYSTAAGYIEEINASLFRVKEKMNIAQKIKLLFK